MAKRRAVFVEPRQSAKLEAVVNAFAKEVAQNSGAILLCVIGAKLSEGIDLKDDLARLVVLVCLSPTHAAQKCKLAWLSQSEASEQDQADFSTSMSACEQ
jgi:hypothetical protein